MNGPPDDESRPGGGGFTSNEALLNLPAPKVRTAKPRTDWSTILERAAEIVREYDTGVTLRQLYYRLVAAELLVNNISSYKSLSKKSAEARRDGWFPPLIDRGRVIHRPMSFRSPEHATDWLRRIYRRDRTEGQDVSVYVGVEKAGLVEQLTSWFDPMGLPVIALGGYSSQSFVDEVVVDVERRRRPAVLLYGGDFDPSGEDIDRDFAERTGCFDKVVRVALSAEQVESYALPPAMGKSTDSRAAAFAARHGRLVQVELDALAPTDLRRLYEAAIDEFVDRSVLAAAMEQERRDLLTLEPGAR